MERCSLISWKSKSKNRPQEVLKARTSKSEARTSAFLDIHVRCPRGNKAYIPTLFPQGKKGIVWTDSLQKAHFLYSVI